MTDAYLPTSITILALLSPRRPNRMQEMMFVRVIDRWQHEHQPTLAEAQDAWAKHVMITQTDADFVVVDICEHVYPVTDSRAGRATDRTH